MTVPQTGVLREVSLREVWPHEAHSFTPWLAENLDQLSEKLDLTLELSGTEVAVTAFSADVLAPNTQDDSIVLIENQLETSDHLHLGQLMTYLAGLDAKTIIWIAKDFRDAHISALEWLNDHTDDDFAFFALRVHAVQIGDSLPAPQFEVCCRPNKWERQLHSVVKESQGRFVEKRTAFWSHLIQRHPSESQYGDASGTSNRRRILSDKQVVISIYVAQDCVGVYVRPMRNSDPQELYARLQPHSDELRDKLGVTLTPSEHGHYFVNKFPAETDDRDRWDELTDWLHDMANKYDVALRSALGGLS